MGLLDIGATLLGGLLGSKGNKTSETQQKSTDPRFDPYLYGADGVLPAAQDWYKNNKTGLNDQMLQGMNNQWNQHEASRPGFNQMQGLGMSLMSGGVAGNPFRNGGNLYGSAGASGAVNSGGPSYQPATPAAQGPGPFQMPPRPAAPPAAQSPGPGQYPPGAGAQDPPHGNERDFGTTSGGGGWSPNELTGGLLGGGAMGYSQGANGFMNGPYGQMIGRLGNAILGQQDPTNVPVRDAVPSNIQDIMDAILAQNDVAQFGLDPGGRGSEGGGWGGHGGNADGYGGGDAGFGNGRAW